MSWRIAGAYFESCNCDAICPCRMIGGVRGGRSTYGACYGALAWRIDEGHADDVDLSGCAAALVVSYDDDEPGSPWSVILHVDERGDERQRRAIEEILLGSRGGDVQRLPWIRKPRSVVDVQASAISLESGAMTLEMFEVEAAVGDRDAGHARGQSFHCRRYRARIQHVLPHVGPVIHARKHPVRPIGHERAHRKQHAVGRRAVDLECPIGPAVRAQWPVQRERM